MDASGCRFSHLDTAYMTLVAVPYSPKVFKVINRTVSANVRQDVLEWLREMCGTGCEKWYQSFMIEMDGKFTWQWVHDYFPHGSPRRSHEHAFYFRDPNKALLFKLTWGGS